MGGPVAGRAAAAGEGGRRDAGAQGSRARAKGGGQKRRAPSAATTRAHPSNPNPVPAHPHPKAAFHVFGMELLARLGPADTNAFFATFFSLPDALWRGFLEAGLSSLQAGGREGWGGVVCVTAGWRDGCSGRPGRSGVHCAPLPATPQCHPRPPSSRHPV